MALCLQLAVTGQSMATLALSVCPPLMKTAQVYIQSIIPVPAKSLLSQMEALIKHLLPTYPVPSLTCIHDPSYSVTHIIPSVISVLLTMTFGCPHCFDQTPPPKTTPKEMIPA